MKSEEPRILLIDIEISPNLGYAWDFYETNLIKVIKERKMLSFAYKWFGEKRIFCHSLRDNTEKQLLKRFRNLLNEADVVVGHNEDKFDLKMVKTFFVKNRMKPPEPYKTVDTLKVARSKFRFNQNGLGPLAEYLDVGKKLDTGGFVMWEGCLKNDPHSWRMMMRYNKHDIFLLDGVYKILRPFANHPALYHKKTQCPLCGSMKTYSRGWDYRVKYKQRRHSCSECGKYFAGDKVYRKKP